MRQWYEHPHTTQMGDMIHCSVCHRSWQTDEKEGDIPSCEPVVREDPRPTYDRPRTNKEKGFDGGQGRRKTYNYVRPSLRR
jgi:hypothetical protein